MEHSKLNFKSGNPGAVQYGNFINYYQFHPAEDRLKLLPTSIWPKTKQYYVLDLGSNAGDLTVALYNFLVEKECFCRILGIDIDPTLVERANEKVKNIESIEFHCLDIMDEKITMWIHLNYGDNGLQRFLKLISDFGDLLIVEPQPWKCYKSAVKRMKLSGSSFSLFPTIKIRQTIVEEIEKCILQNCRTSKLFESKLSNWGRKIQIFKHLTDT